MSTATGTDAATGGAAGAPWPRAGDPRPQRAPWALGVLAALLVLAGALAGLHLPNLHNGLIAATCTTVGVFVLAHRPGHREGWLFLATGLAHAVMFAGRQYGFAAADGAHLPAASWVTWLGVWPLAPVLVLTGVTLMCFPDGRLPSLRWRPVVAMMVVAGAALGLASALWPVEYVDDALSVVHPLELPGATTAQRVWDVAGPACFLLFQLAWLAAVAARLRRASGTEARRLRWFASAVAAGAGVMVLGLVVLHSPLPGVLAVPLIPLAAGLAIVRHRLYDIDPVIDTAVVVGAMAALTTAGYVAVVIGVGHLLGVSPGPHPLLPLAATALVAVAFEPARRRVQRVADRLVYGDRPSPYEALARLPAQLSRGDGSADLFTVLASTVADSIGAAAVTLWIGPDDALVAVAAWPPASGEQLGPAPRALTSLADGGRTTVRPIVHQGQRRGAVTVTTGPGRALTTHDDRLLQDLVAQAGLVVDHQGLGVELRQRLAQISAQAVELQAAARRLVAAQDEARRRIERDLHDGAQQRLVTLALDLQWVAGRAAAAGDGTLVAAVDRAQGDLSLALAELREMARGIHPAILVQEGVDAALAHLAERSTLPVQLDVQLPGRLSRDVEATAYFVVSEALTNAAKHSGATQVTVIGRLDAGRLELEVTDDGRGGADGHWGSGLQGLVDRLATANGRLTVHSPVGGGTRLRAEVPCA